MWVIDSNYDKLGNITYFGSNQPYDYAATWNNTCPTPLPTQAMPNAVRQIGSPTVTSYFCYNKNGNMVKRVEGSLTYTQNFNVENELASVVVGSNTTGFSYDAAGQRVKTEIGSKIIYYPFPGYEEEVNGTALTRRVTYTVAGQAVANRVHIVSPTPASNTLYHLYTDHLGSTTTLSTTSGGTVTGSSAYYYPFGNYRGTPPTQTITDRTFTGQKGNLSLGLIYYNARFYIPGVGRFLSADTLIPNPANPQSFNRYSYVRNSPLNFSDPSGHRECDLETGDCGGGPGSFTPQHEKGLGELEGGKYDLTDWLAEEMVLNATGSDMLAIQELRSGNIFEQMQGIVPFYDLNANNGRWNFKEQTKSLLGSEMIVLCGNEECGWFDYSTPGNIHFGFVAAAAGVRETLSMAAGGLLEALDSNYNGLSHLNEHPADWAGVELGYALYDIFGVDMTPEQLRIGLDVYWDQLQRPDPRLLKPADGIFPPKTPYSIGVFDYE